MIIGETTQIGKLPLSYETHVGILNTIDVGNNIESSTEVVADFLYFNFTYIMLYFLTLCISFQYFIIIN